MVFIFFVCLLMVAWLTAGAMAVRSASRIWLRHWAEQRLRGAATVLVYLERPQRLLAAAQTGVALTVGFVGLWIGWKSPRDEGVAILSVIGYAAVVILFGHLVPRAIARRWPSFVIPLTVPVLQLIETITSPILSAGRFSGAPEAPTTPSRVPAAHDAIQELLREGEIEGVGRRDEIAIITGVMEFGVKTVAAVMTPRSDTFAVPRAQDARSVARSIAESAFSRVPVSTASRSIASSGCITRSTCSRSAGSACRPCGRSRTRRRIRPATSCCFACSRRACISRSCTTSMAARSAW